jgi:hypothetical protein
MRLEGRLLQDFVTFLPGRTLAEPLIAQAAIDWACSRGGSQWQAGRQARARLRAGRVAAAHSRQGTVVRAADPAADPLLS